LVEVKRMGNLSHRSSIAGTIVLGVLFAGASGASFWLANREQDGLIPDEWIKDLGEFPQQTEAHTRFALKNNTGEPISLIRVEPNCACTGAILGATELAPGESSEVRVSVATGEHRGPLASKLHVLYRPKEREELKVLRLAVGPTVVPQYEVEPGALYFDLKRPIQHDVRVAAAHGSRVKVLRAYVTHAAFEAEIVEKPGAQEATVVRVRLIPERWTDDLVGQSLVIDTDSKQQPTHRVPITVFAR
jgi:hypothetical protein